MYKIETDVPISSRRKYPVQELCVNESFFVPFEDLPSKDSSSVKAIVHRFARKSGRSFKTRKEEFGVRVWRIK